VRALAGLTPEDWTALASLDPHAREIEIDDPAMLRRWHDAYIVSGLGGSLAYVLSFGRGVSAAARVLVKRAEPQPGLAAVGCPEHGIKWVRGCDGCHADAEACARFAG
jgi:hypothetical protein